MSDLRDLYQQVILDHYRKPRNQQALIDANRSAEGHNPLCGDRVRVALKVAGDTIEDVAFEGSGCAISTASASLMTEAVKGKTVDQAEALFRSFRAVVTGDDGALVADDLGKLEVLAGVRDYPVRIKCATLAWHTLESALAGEAGSEPVSTE